MLTEPVQARSEHVVGIPTDPFGDARQVPIAKLDTTCPPPSDVYFKAVVALIYPYSSHMQTAAVLLVDPDMRQRSRRGQVRVQFHGAAAVAFGSSRIGSGDELCLSLRGASWVEQDKSAVHTPGRSVDAELAYEMRLVLQANTETSPQALLNVDAPAAARPVSEDSDIFRSDRSSPVMPLTTPAIARARSRMNIGYDSLSQELSPIVFDDDDYDPFLVDSDNQYRPRKKTKLGRKSGDWKLVGWRHNESSLTLPSTGPVEQQADSPSRNSRKLPPISQLSLPESTSRSTVVDLISPDESYPASLPLPTSNFAGNNDGGGSLLNDASRNATEMAEISAPDALSVTVGDQNQFHAVLETHDTIPETLAQTHSPANLDSYRHADSNVIPKVGSSIIEPLFGSSIPTISSSRLGTGSQLNVASIPPVDVASITSERPVYDTTGFVHPSSATMSDQNEVLALQKPYEHGYNSVLEAPPPLLSASDLPEHTAFDSQDAELDLSQPPLSTNLFQNRAPSIPPSPITSAPQSPLLRPIPSRDLSLVSPLPSSSEDHTQPLSSLTATFQASNATSQTSQSIQRSFDEKVVETPDLNFTQTSPVLLEDPGAPPDTTMIPDDPQNVTSAHEDGPGSFEDRFPQGVETDKVLTPLEPLEDSNAAASQEVQKAPVEYVDLAESDDEAVPQTVREDTVSNAADTLRDFGKVAHESYAAQEPAQEPARTLAQEMQSTQSELHMRPISSLDGAQDILPTARDDREHLSHVGHGQYEEQEPRPVTETALHKSTVQAEQHALTPVDPVQNLVSLKEIREEADTEAVPAADDKRASKTVDTSSNDQDLAPSVSKSRDRTSLVPETLSNFFEIAPPRRSHRQTRPTEKIRYERDGAPDANAHAHPPSGGTEATHAKAPLDALAQKSPHGIDMRISPPRPALSLKFQSPAAKDGVDQSQTSPTPSKATETVAKENSVAGFDRDKYITLVESRVRGFRTDLSYYAALSNMDVYLNASSSESQGSLFDIFAVVTQSSSSPTRAKSGPKHHLTVMHLTDKSLSSSDVQVECFRPRKEALPVTAVGDVILLREPIVKSREGKLYLISGSTSAWHVWKFSTLADDQSETEAATSQVVQECRGPQVELGPEEQQHAQALHFWWLSIREGWRKGKQPAKGSPSKRRDKRAFSKDGGKQSKGKSSRF